MGRKWDRCPEYAKINVVFLEGNRAKTINTWSIVTESLIENFKSWNRRKQENKRIGNQLDHSIRNWNKPRNHRDSWDGRAENGSQRLVFIHLSLTHKYTRTQKGETVLPAIPYWLQTELWPESAAATSPATPSPHQDEQGLPSGLVVAHVSSLGRCRTLWMQGQKTQLKLAISSEISTWNGTFRISWLDPKAPVCFRGIFIVPLISPAGFCFVFVILLCWFCSWKLFQVVDKDGQPTA